MTIDEFVKARKIELDLFERYWQEQLANKAEGFKNDLHPADWREQEDIYAESVAGDLRA